ncbi:MAG: hypothetical protein IKU01_08415 [Bacteroidales bacterium]|nr:hypothetical protein [Bacteroidales bacterium]
MYFFRKDMKKMSVFGQITAFLGTELTEKYHRKGKITEKPMRFETAFRHGKRTPETVSRYVGGIGRAFMRQGKPRLREQMVAACERRRSLR